MSMCSLVLNELMSWPKIYGTLGSQGSQAGGIRPPTFSLCLVSPNALTFVLDECQHSTVPPCYSGFYNL